MILFFLLFSLILSILGDPGAVSRDGTRIGTGVKFSSKTTVPILPMHDFLVPSRLTAPGSPRMNFEKNWHNLEKRA